MTTSADDPLVTTDWLAARLDDPKIKIIDASYKMPGVLPLPSDDYLGGHIPGAVFFDVGAIADPIPAPGLRHRGRGGCSCRSVITR
jgi:thiosulfate/3-mercaptopyruvate sulfurtransferase